MSLQREEEKKKLVQDDELLAQERQLRVLYLKEQDDIHREHMAEIEVLFGFAAVLKKAWYYPQIVHGRNRDSFQHQLDATRDTNDTSAGSTVLSSFVRCHVLFMMQLPPRLIIFLCVFGSSQCALHAFGDTFGRLGLIIFLCVFGSISRALAAFTSLSNAPA